MKSDAYGDFHEGQPTLVNYSRGKASGIEVELVKLLAKNHQLPVTYAGGVGSFQDLETLRMAGKNRVDVTVGSALDLFGGSMKWEDVLDICQKSENYFEK